MWFVYLCNERKKINKQEVIKEHLRPTPGDKCFCGRGIKFFLLIGVCNIIYRIFFFYIFGSPAGGHKPNAKLIFYTFCSPCILYQEPQVNKIYFNRVPCFYRSCYSINRFYFIKLLLKSAKKLIPENKYL